MIGNRALLESMGEWTRVPKKDLGPGKSLRISVEGDDVALFQVGSGFFAVSNQCPHQHFSRIHEGSLGDGTITCPMHGWTFDLQTGECRTGGGRLRTYAVQIEGDVVLVKKGK